MEFEITRLFSVHKTQILFSIPLEFQLETIYIRALPKDILQCNFLKEIHLFHGFGFTEEDIDDESITFYFCFEEVIYLAQCYSPEHFLLNGIFWPRPIQPTFDNIYNGLKHTNASRISIIYPVYSFFRNEKYIVRSGLKYGVDFILYDKSPIIVHARYSVKIGNFLSNDIYQGLSKSQLGKLIKWRDIIGLLRLTEAVSKDLLLVTPDLNDKFKIHCTCIQRHKI
ncbi:tRNA intron endonuclease, catalytic C-terminal domain-containing protein [Cryptosporidium serpentis]